MDQKKQQQPQPFSERLSQVVTILQDYAHDSPTYIAAKKQLDIMIKDPQQRLQIAVAIFRHVKDVAVNVFDEADAQSLEHVLENVLQDVKENKVLIEDVLLPTYLERCIFEVRLPHKRYAGHIRLGLSMYGLEVSEACKTRLRNYLQLRQELEAATERDNERRAE